VADQAAIYLRYAQSVHARSEILSEEPG
jgi:hypothetical protein